MWHINRISKKDGTTSQHGKTQTMNVIRELGITPVTKIITLGQYNFKKLEQFKCQGIIVSQKNYCQIEIQQIIEMGNK